MADQLTSVRFDDQTIGVLRTLADINDTSVAEEIRDAVRRRIAALPEDKEIRARVEESGRRRQEAIGRLLGAHR
jgi:hypothetical protein